MRYKTASFYQKAARLLLLCLLMLAQVGGVVQAAPPPPIPIAGRVCTPSTDPDANVARETGCILANTVAALLKIGGALALIAIIINGIKIATAGGDPKTIADARRSLVFAIIGALIAVGGVFIVVFIGNLVGITGDFTNVDLSP
jgi:hypothetical protein